MNNLLKTLMLLAVASMFFSSCKNDNPQPINEEELITTVELTFTGGGETKTIEWYAADGENGTITPTTLQLKPNTNYAVAVRLLNEEANPIEDITEEVKEEGEEHQFFYIRNNTNIFTSFAYLGGTDNDTNGNPIGINTTASTGTVGSSGTLRIVLRHLLIKTTTNLAIDNFQPNTAGGSTDIDVTFNISIAN